MNHSKLLGLKLTNFLWSHFINHFDPLDTCTYHLVCLVDLHCRLTFPTNSMYCNCVLSFMFCRLYWLFNVYFPATLEHTRVVCQSTSYHLFITIVFHYLGCKVHNNIPSSCPLFSSFGKVHVGPYS